MIPAIYPEEIVIFKPIRSNYSLLNRGSVVVAKHPIEPKKVIIKRIHKVTSNGLDLRGDNLRLSTDSRQFGLISLNRILGIVQYIVK